MKKPKIARAGFNLACQHCKCEIYTLVQDVIEGDTISAEQFTGINGFPSPINGEEMRCPNCKKMLTPKSFSNILTAQDD